MDLAPSADLYLGPMRHFTPLVPADRQRVPTARLVHLELHTPDRAAARALYRELLGWRAATVAGSYVALDRGGDVGGGIAECGTERSMWLP